MFSIHSHRRSLPTAVLAIVTMFLLIAAVASPRVLLAATEAQKQAAIAAGLQYLQTNQNPDGSWTGYYGYYNNATTAAAVQCIAVTNPSNTASINAGLDYLFNNAQVLDLSTVGGPQQTGVSWNNSGEETYQTAFVVPAIVSAGALNTPTSLIDPITNLPMTRYDVLQATVNSLAAGQLADGGWRYTLLPYLYPGSDNSVSQWGALALRYAKHANVQVPQSTLSGLATWTDTIQDPVSGGSDYQPGSGWINVAKTGGILTENVVSGGGNRTKALDFINTHWIDGNLSGGGGNIGDTYAMWSAYKGLEATIGLDDYTTITNLDTTIQQPIDPTPAHPYYNWWDNYCDYLVYNQQFDGSWADYGQVRLDPNMTAAFDTMILNGTTIPEPSTLVLLGIGTISLLAYVWRRRRLTE